ncbi:MAG TPA: 50S ribosomal protein L4 [Candidatus Stercoripulliclostridium merdigallinarum]|uniref:Large ribosomal subunit protein uL4 n=1 Tax=Candidatus Stercoripulliclostridium merdigallinarum TaxID=2840951 RepID=A0A9D1SI33_9FIRM|nr:50S ribosomal protein L4 [Candidatus Stercoripulliclostridium merdigallinarum]
MKAQVINSLGKKVKKIELNDEVFAAEYNEPLIHQAIVAQLANARQGTKSALTRTEVRGGGVKPWRQKGTGRARQGSIRAPQWTHGGVVFAPKPRDFSKKLNKKMRQGAFISAISKKFSDGDVIILDKLTLDSGKTRDAVKVLNAIGVTKSAIVVTRDVVESVKRAINNIPKVELSPAELLSVYDVVKADKCIFTEEAIMAVQDKYFMTVEGEVEDNE